MSDTGALANEPETAELIRVRGLVQGVGFRPMVWRLARRHGLRGWVGNDGDGVAACVCGSPSAVAGFVQHLRSEAPPLARIEGIERAPAPLPDGGDFRIVASRTGTPRTGVVPDAATCPDCRAETFDPAARRFGYAFANCTHCGPRLSIVEAIPYDRATTTMRAFDLCAECAGEYADPGDRRFHAQPIACPRCGPQVWLAHGDGRPAGALGADALDAARRLLADGRILAVKGLGGFQLACDAADETAVARLRQGKRREKKPFALMARDLDAVRRHCRVTPDDEAALQSAVAPIVIMDRLPGETVAPSVAPGVGTLGFMLPNTPLHHLLLRDFDRPIVLTSGNVSEEPQCIGNAEAAARLGDVADHLLLHDRDIARRVDDSVVRRMAGSVRVLRRARGYAPAPLQMPPGFADSPPLLAMGGELKNSFGLLRGSEMILSHHMGDLENALAFADYRRAIDDYRALFAHAPEAIAIDMHPEYLSSKLGVELSERHGTRLVEVQHHHAHIAACMAENGVAPDAGPVIGVALDGLGYGTDGTIWGGEVLVADYRGFRRLARLQPVAMPGGVQAIREPWRNFCAHIAAAMGWERFDADYGTAPIAHFLADKPRHVLDAMMARGVNSPLASSCGRLFDAVAAALGVCRERAQYEGQAAVELEALVEPGALAAEGDEFAYSFDLTRPRGGPIEIDPAPMWQALLRDLVQDAPKPLIAGRFHKGLAMAVAATIAALRASEPMLAGVRRVALSGGVLQNRVLLEQLMARVGAQELDVLAHRKVPAGDGGLALGQAAVAAARLDGGMSD